ncbi:YceI family protein [Massilia sp. BSC265]|uniref:YceI family protein n=1 Tax=Massilia sp. BSC265 TaxID=1549812 RepID=UPI0004E86DA2|nr:YceI family protein [Massilia sp. BSC265]KFI06145.1 polyisoprenoid-binding protein [Massilia sp. BSC265]
MKPVKSLLLASLFASAVVGAAPLKTDPAKSSVTATFKQMGVPVEAKFKQFTAQIDYDAAKPAASKATVEIQTASLDLGDPDYNKEVTKKEWFNTAQFPKATFVSSSIAPAGAGKFNVTGKLSIKGRSANVSFPLVAKTEAGKQVFEGQLPIKRLAFNIGEDEWKDTSMVADEVVIKFRVVAQ